MSSKKKLIIMGSIFLTLLLLIGINFLIPRVVIELNGEKIVTLEVGNEYIEEGAKAYLKSPFSSEELKLDTIGLVDKEKLGMYRISYETKYHNKVIKDTRLVKVIDTTKPEITINKEVTACEKNNLINIDAKVIDNYDGDITDKLTYKVVSDEVLISVQDTSGNTEVKREKIKYIDSEKPKITLKGSENITLTVGEEYTEYGASATDSCDGTLSDIKITSNVDVNKVGSYEVKYTVEDSLGNKTEKTRNVRVKEKEVVKPVTGGVIYLTFDDGPGVYTEEILNTLDKYGVKATFFVTNQFPKYQSLIKKEYEKGHTVGVHTYSHKWSVYDSVDTYLDDFNKMENIVFEQTGVHPKYFRFPGGSSNTVSIKHCKGVMSKLAYIMEEKGYTYFDWTFDSGDTSKTKNSAKAILNTVKTYLKGDGEYIILMHDIKKNTKDVLPQVIEYAKSRGYVFKAIDENTNVKHFKIAN